MRCTEVGPEGQQCSLDAGHSGVHQVTASWGPPVAPAAPTPIDPGHAPDQRASLRASLIDQGLREADVDAWLDAWAGWNKDKFWDEAHDWIIGQVALGKKPL